MKIHLKKIVFFVCLLFYFLHFGLIAQHTLPAIKDSIHEKSKNGQTFILHTVKKNETAYKIANQYKITVARLLANNPKAAKGLKFGQILEIPAPASKTPLPAAQTQKSKVKIHIVGSGQTLFGIAQQYNVSIDEIKYWNNLTTEQLNMGQQLQVSAIEPLGKPSSKPNKKTITTQTIPTTAGADRADTLTQKGNTHVVEPSQTLFSISKKYRVSVDKIKLWNGLLGNELLVGQALIINAEGYKEAQQAVLATKTANETPPANPTTNPTVGQIEAQTTATDNPDPEKKPVIPAFSAASPNPQIKISAENGYDRIIETGLAEVIDQSSDTRKHLCLHKSAPVGAILQVKNESNGNIIFIRVIGRLPNTGPNEKIILRISKKAYERLNPASKRFVVEVSYPKS